MPRPTPTARDREEAVRALRERDRLRRRIASAEKDLHDVEARLETAGEEDDAASWQRVKAGLEEALRGMRAAMEACEDIAEGIKAREREALRRYMDEALENVRRRTDQARRVREEWDRGRRLTALPGFEQRPAPGAALAFLGACLLFLTVVGVLWLCTR